jgi:hypothetical protein
MIQTTVSFQLTQEEKEILEMVYYLEPWLPDAVDNRRMEDDKYQFKLVNDDYKDCLSALEYQADLEPVDGYKFIALTKKIRQVYRLKYDFNRKRRFPA